MFLEDLQLDPDQVALDLAIKNLGIVAAYEKWCGKMTPKVGGRRESIMVSCPDPNHPDTNPSAWINLDKGDNGGVYYCPGCSYGGDVWDIAAFGLGFPVPGYKNDPEQFRRLREVIGLDLGFNIVHGYGGSYVVPPVEPEAKATEAVSSDTEPPAPTEEAPVEATVGVLPSAVQNEQAEEEFAADRNGPSIPWRDIIPEDTFLREWMYATTIDDCPEEFHFWTGLQAIGFAIGRKKTLWDLRPVVGNLFTCLVGPSGSGKSRAKEHLTVVLDRVLKHNPSTHVGVKFIKAPGSAEYLVQAFSATEDDPNNPAVQIMHPVRGLVEFEELSTLMSVGGRAGSALKPQLMDIYDARMEISSGSLGHGFRSAREPFGQCISTTQTESLRRLLDKGDDVSGFMNRWVFASGALKPQRALGGKMVTLDKPAEMLNQIYLWAWNEAVIEWTEPAEQLWTEFFHSTLVPAKDAAEKGGSAMLNRLDLLLKKLILLFTANIRADVVPKAAVEQAIALYGYLLQTFGAVNTQIERTEDSDLVDKILGVIEKITTANAIAPTRRDIYQSVRKTLKNTEQLAKLLKHMVELGVIKEITPVRKPGQRGQLGVRYAIGDN